MKGYKIVIDYIFNFRKLPLRSEVIVVIATLGVKDDTTMRHVNDHLSYKTYVANFFNFSNFFNFKQVELAKLESYFF